MGSNQENASFDLSLMHYLTLSFVCLLWHLNKCFTIVNCNSRFILSRNLPWVEINDRISSPYKIDHCFSRLLFFFVSIDHSYTLYVFPSLPVSQSRSLPLCLLSLNLVLSLSVYLFLNGPFPASFFFIFVFSIQLTENVEYKFWWWLDSNYGLLVFEVTALPTEPQPLPNLWHNHPSARLAIFFWPSNSDTLSLSA